MSKSRVSGLCFVAVNLGTKARGFRFRSTLAEPWQEQAQAAAAPADQWNTFKLCAFTVATVAGCHWLASQASRTTSLSPYGGADVPVNSLSEARYRTTLPPRTRSMEFCLEFHEGTCKIYMHLNCGCLLLPGRAPPSPLKPELLQASLFRSGVQLSIPLEGHSLWDLALFMPGSAGSYN